MGAHWFARLTHCFLSGLRYKNVLPLLDYFTINIYPFLSSGTKGVAMSNLTGPEMNFLNDQISALRNWMGAGSCVPVGLMCDGIWNDGAWDCMGRTLWV